MSRRRKTKAKKQRPALEPEDVLDDSVEFRVEELFDLIHRVNPTGQRLSPKEQSRRYTLKRRLQSLLIRRFGDDDLNVATTPNAGVVALDHPSGLRDACHAIVAELEPDARSWVRLQLDLAASRGEELELPAPDFDFDTEAEPGIAGEVSDLLERGRQALEDYDYEQGEELLRRAFAKSRDAPGEVAEALGAAAARALLELQVDVLGLDAAALELEPQLSAAAKERPGIRTLLALAAARLGEVERARELVAGLTAAVAGVSLPRAAEVYAAMVSRAIHDHDSRAARHDLERVAELDPTHAGIPAFEAEIARLKAENLSGIEADLERRFHDLGAAAVETEARALADRWPQGEVARRILRQAAAERRETEIAEHLELGEQARAEDRFDDAARHFQAALDGGSERPELPVLAAEMADRARREHERSEVDGVLRRFAAGSEKDARRDALIAYLSLAEDLRGRVREVVDQPALGWLDEIESPRSGAKAQAAVAAVLALGRATAALEGGEAEDAAGLIEPHKAVLRQVERARSLGREAFRQIAEGRRRRALERLDAALAAFAEGQPEDARRHLAAISRGDLEDGDLARFQGLQARIDDVGKLERLEHEHDERLAAGDLPGALKRARKLAEESREESSEAASSSGQRWQRGVEELKDRIRSAWHLEVVEDEDLSIEDALLPSNWLESSAVWLDDDGRELVLANAWQQWLFIDAVDVARGRIASRVSFRTPGPLERPLLTLRDGDRLWIAGREGNVLEIARDGWKILGYYPAGELLSGDRKVERARPMPGGAWLWLRVSEPWEADEVCLADLRDWYLVRKLPGGARWVPILGPGEPRMLLTGPRFAARIYTAGGELTGSEPLVKRSVLDADLGPDGRGLLVLLSEPDVDGGDGGGSGLIDRSLSLMRFVEAPDGALRRAARHQLPQAHRHYGFHAVVASPDRCLSFVLIYTRDNDVELLIFSGDGPPDRLEPIIRSRWPSRTTLVHDRRGRHVVAMRLDSGIELKFLDLETAPFAGDPRARERDYPNYKVHVSSCSQPYGSFGAEVRKLADELEERGVGPLRTHLARIESSKTAGIDDKVRVALALRQGKRERDLRDAIEGFARRMVRKHPSHPGAALLLADIEGVAERWGEVSRLVGRVDPAGLDVGLGRHFHHLEGLAHLHGGRLDEAHETFRRGMTYDPGYCAIEPLMHLTQPMADPPAPGDWAPDQPTIRRLVGAIRTADRAFAAGDLAAARSALDRRDLRWQEELQIAARRARVYLETLASTAAERFSERAALTFYAHVRQLGNAWRHNLFLPDLRWDEERLAEIEEQTLARLEELGGA